VREPNNPYNSRRRDNAEHGLKVESSAGHQRRKRGAADCTAAPPSELPSAVLELANLYAAYARDISAGTRLAPTFADAVRMHAIIDLIEHSSKTGSRVDVPATPLQLPGNLSRALPGLPRLTKSCGVFRAATGTRAWRGA
jgi:predicted dehydrogenase